MGRKRIESFEDLEVYQKLVQLHLEVHALTLTFPKHEMHEVGSQLRQSLTSIPANLAEGWNNRHINVYLEGINRSLGELRETKHHLTVSFKKGYFAQVKFDHLVARYDECGRMLKGLERALLRFAPEHLPPITYALMKAGSGL